MKKIFNLTLLCIFIIMNLSGCITPNNIVKVPKITQQFFIFVKFYYKPAEPQSRKSGSPYKEVETKVQTIPKKSKDIYSSHCVKYCD